MWGSRGPSVRKLKPDLIASSKVLNGRTSFVYHSEELKVLTHSVKGIERKRDREGGGEDIT